MSGALENTASGGTFVNTFKGKFTIKTNPETEGAIKRTNKNGKEVHELHYNQLSNVIIQKFEKWHDEEYGYSWNIYLIHATSGDTYKLTLPFSGRITMGLFLRLPNMNMSQACNLRLYYFEEEDKSALVVYQNNNKVEPFWTKEEPKDLPPLKDLGIVNGKQAWGSDERMAFIEKYIKEQVEPRMLEMDDSPSDIVDEVEAEEDQTPKENEPIWDQELKVLKKKDEDGKFYECDENGKFKVDQEGNKISTLPF